MCKLFPYYLMPKIYSVGLKLTSRPQDKLTDECMYGQRVLADLLGAEKLPWCTAA